MDFFNRQPLWLQLYVFTFAVFTVSADKIQVHMYKAVFDRGKAQLVCNVFPLPYLANVAMQCVTTNNANYLTLNCHYISYEIAKYWFSDMFYVLKAESLQTHLAVQSGEITWPPIRSIYDNHLTFWPV